MAYLPMAYLVMAYTVMVGAVAKSEPEVEEVVHLVVDDASNGVQDAGILVPLPRPLPRELIEDGVSNKAVFRDYAVLASFREPLVLQVEIGLRLSAELFSATSLGHADGERRGRLGRIGGQHWNGLGKTCL